ncbi:MAG: extracellular solute-binding protein [Holosporales bacterium]|nr:extracellular solute-binding protein [Holosporales bacterium]
MGSSSKSIFYFWAISLLAALLLLLAVVDLSDKPCVNLYDWYGVLPREVIEQFEKETGIKVNYDVFDNNEMLEAKLLARNSGYDIVFPTLTPNAARQLSMGIYQKIDKSLLPNLKKIAPFLLEKMQKIDGGLEFLLPYYWGTTGIAFDEDKLNRLLPNHPKDGYSLLFDVDVVLALRDAGISFLQEATDIFPHVLNYIGLDRENKSFNDLVEASKHLAKISPYIRRFSSSRFVTDLVFGDICVAQAWSGEAIKAIEDAKKVGRNIKYIIPKEGTDIWIDVIAIPAGAPNVKNAHTFINFLLQPQVSAKITNQSKIATMVVEAKEYIDKEILENILIFPDEATQQRLYLCPPFLGEGGEAYNRARTRIWAQLKIQRDKVDKYINEIVSNFCKTQGATGKRVRGIK